MKTSQEESDFIYGLSVEQRKIYHTIKAGTKLDAWKQGMTDAANMVLNQKFQSDFALCHKNAEIYMTEKIEKARDNKTEL